MCKMFYAVIDLTVRVLDVVTISVVSMVHILEEVDFVDHQDEHLRTSYEPNQDVSSILYVLLRLTFPYITMKYW